MAITAAILNYRRFLKRRNYSGHTIKNYMHTLKQFVVWVDVPIEAVNHKKLLAYLDHLLDRGLKPETFNCHLAGDFTIISSKKSRWRWSTR